MGTILVVPVHIQERLRRCADVIVRVGLNLRPGQRVLMADPFDLQGVPREAAALVGAVEAAARDAGAREVEVIWADTGRLRLAAERWPDRGFESVLAQNTARMEEQVAAGDALLFLHGSHPRLMAGVSIDRVAALRERCWQYYGRVARDLVAGRTNWTVAPAPTPVWADTVFPEVAAGRRLERLWEAVFEALRVGTEDPVAAWRDHLAALEATKETLNGRPPDRLRLLGPGTDLAVSLPAGHIWCTARLRTSRGHPFVANLPTEEVFTAPDFGSATGRLTVARPVAYAGAAIEGIELEFREGCVVRARASRGGELLRRVLETDEGARRLGEVALVPAETSLARSGAFFHHPLLDENALPHVALGDAYAFTAAPKAWPRLNHSLIHLDLPIEARIAPDFPC